MTETLATYVARCLKDPESWEQSIRTPYLVYEVVEQTARTEETRQWTGGHFTRSSPVQSTEERVFPLAKTQASGFAEGVTVGRTPENDLVLHNANISRFHAWFKPGSDLDEWYIIDAGSKNGTWMNGQKLGAKEPVSLPNGGRIKFGPIEVRFLLPAEFIDLVRSRARS